MRAERILIPLAILNLIVLGLELAYGAATAILRP